MTTSAKAFRFDDSTLWIDLQDGRTVGAPLVRGDATNPRPAAA
jgi:hypothetical protein